MCMAKTGIIIELSIRKPSKLAGLGETLAAESAWESTHEKMDA